MAKITIWKDTTYSELHQVSSDGQVRNKKTMRILKPAERNGYFFVQLKNRGRSLNIHRLVAEAFLPNPRGVGFVNHKNGLKNDNRIENLEWVTASENARHRVDTLRKGLGTGHGRSRYSESQILEMRDLWSKGIPSGLIADQFKSSIAAVHTICTGKTWKHLPVTKRPPGFTGKSLSFCDAEKIRYLKSVGRTGSSLAREFGVDPSTVTKVVKHKCHRSKKEASWLA